MVVLGSMIGSVSYAATPSNILGIPTATFCNTYAKDVATKSVAIGIVVKIKDDPSKKASLMRQYGTFVALGKQHCKSVTYKPTTTPVVTGSVAHGSDDGFIPVTGYVYDTKTNAQFLKPEDYFTGYDTTPMNGLTVEEVQTTIQRIAKAKQVYADIIEDFISKSWLQPSDRDQMVGKIAFNLSNNCNELDGKILVRQRYDKNHNPLNNELVNLFITINLCFQPNYEANYNTFIKRIVYHELGHYLDYFHDRDDSVFRNMCWSGNTKTCTDDAFITSYAESAPDEDYAETFSYYIQDGSSVNDPILQHKIDYFKAKFPK